MKDMKKITLKITAFLVALCAIYACSSEEIIRHESAGIHSCRLVWDGEIRGYGDETRAQYTPKDGDCVYLRFKSGANNVDGKAVYDHSLDEWVLTYNGSLTMGETSACSAYYINKVSEESGSGIKVSPHTLVCRDVEATYFRGENYVRLSAHLTPCTGRIRFKGEAGRTFQLSGVEYITDIDIKALTHNNGQESLELAIGEDGFTPYVYALPLSDRILTICYDFQTYKTTCESPILDVASSGYMLLPTEKAHNGWNLVKVEEPILSAVVPGVLSDVTAEVCAEVLSLNNGTLLDAGFVYSETPEPTLDSYKVSCGVVRKLTTTLHGLKPETDYYVRAYATNERGTAYSEELKIRTTATPTVPTVRTGTASDVQAYSAVFSATIDNLGEVSEITQHGHVWSTTPNPTTSANKTRLGITSRIGEYTSKLTDLMPNTTYYVRAYAVNAVGTGYGEEISFTTDFAPVELKTSAATSITSKSAVIGGRITSKGGHTVVECGVCWATKASPTVSDNILTASKVEDNFTQTLAGLQEKTTYYVRSYVRTTTGALFYGNEVSFTTTPKEVDIEIGDYDDDEFWKK